jgi:hypothetical protein
MHFMNNSEKSLFRLASYMVLLAWLCFARLDPAPAYWEFCSGFGVYDATAKEWNEPLLNALLH